VGFVLVSSPAAVSIEEALAFHERLHAEAMPVAGVVANRVTPDLWPSGSLPSPGELARALAEQGREDGDLAGRLATTLAEHQALARAEARALERLFGATAAVPRATVPRLETDVHDLGGLARMAEQI
jgi:anion-transporting  ArsA/GET3 family ATPase